MVDTSKLVGERLAEFEQDRAESNRRYGHAFSVVLSHTSAIELEEFWRLLSPAKALEPPDGGITISERRNPMVGGWPSEFAHPRTSSAFEGRNPMALATGGRDERANGSKPAALTGC